MPHIGWLTVYQVRLLTMCTVVQLTMYKAGRRKLYTVGQGTKCKAAMRLSIPRHILHERSCEKAHDGSTHANGIHLSRI